MNGPGYTNMGREHAEHMAEQERAEERACRRLGLPSPYRGGVVRPVVLPQCVQDRMQREARAKEVK